MSEKTKWPLAEAQAVAEEIRAWIYEACERSLIAGSVRRRKPMVGDIELVFIPKLALGDSDLFSPTSVVDVLLERFVRQGLLGKRLNVKDRESWGPSNKLAIHLASGIPVDFFATTELAWWNYVVCRTGPSESNTAIASLAKDRGWKWCPAREGFERRTGLDQGRMVRMNSERDVFAFVGLPYLDPPDRL